MHLMPPLELALRTGTVAILLLLGAIMVRDRKRLQSKAFSGLMALSVAADGIMTIVGYGPLSWLTPLQLIAAGTSALLWIWIGTLFIDGFRPSWRAAVAWAALPAWELVSVAIYWRPWMVRVEEAGSLLFVLLAGWRAVAGLRGDLVERRRRLRPILASAAVVYSIVIIVRHAWNRGGGVPGIADGTWEAAGLAALSVGFAMLALRVDSPIFSPPEATTLAPPPPVLEDADADAASLARLRALMEEEKIYRREGFDLGMLVTALDLPEYRLRRLINQRLGHRNFSSFVNVYRLGEAKAALADPAQADVPVLTIALDAGFQSIGPFNRAFKAETGLTPTEYRKQAETRKL